MKARVLVIALASIALAIACSSEGGSGFDSGGGGQCCQPSASPSCCMVLGGWSSDGMCGQICDGIPNPDQGWKQVTDTHGCKTWQAPYSCYPTPMGGSCCGGIAPPKDSGADAPIDAPVDAPSDVTGG